MVTLVPVGSGHHLAPAPAAAYLRARAAGAPPGITSSTRTRAEQAVLYAAYVAGTGALASRPGTSKHELGQALDLPDEGANPRAWPHWDEYGWVRTNSETWHREYRASADRHLTDGTTTPTPITPTWEDDNMALSDEAVKQITTALTPIIAAEITRARSVVLADVAGIGTCVVDLGARTYQHVGEAQRDIALAHGLDHLKNQGSAYLAGFTKIN